MGRQRDLRRSLPALAVAVTAMASSAVLVRWADTSPLAFAFWRTLGGSLVLTAVLVLRRRGSTRSERSESTGGTGRPRAGQWRGIVLAGAALGVHFAAWLASLRLTSVAASVTLVSTAPLLIALVLVLTGRGPGPRTWAAIVLGLIGTAIIAGGDAVLGAADDDALLGDALALLGAAAMAVYLMVGDRLRAELSTAAYAARTYGVAALCLGATALVVGVDVTDNDRTGWLAIGAMIIGPQLAGHTTMNFLLGRLDSVTVSLALLVEPVAAGLLVWLLFTEVPPVGVWIGAPLVLAAVAARILDRAEPTTTVPTPTADRS